MDKSRNTYWAVYEGKSIRFEGTFTQCWTNFVSEFGDSTLADLHARGIRVARKS